MVSRAPRLVSNRKVLFIAYDFPPCRATGSGLRSERFVKFLPRSNWEPTVLCLGPSIAAEMYEDVHRIQSSTPWRWPYELTPYGWGRPLRSAAKQLTGSKNFAVVYASCPPFAPLGSICKLASKLKLPLVLDFRDGWTVDPYVEGSRLKRWLTKHVFPTMELKAFQAASLVLLNSPSALAAYAKRYPVHVPKLRLLPNGFDDEDFAGPPVKCPQPDGLFTLVHVGRFGVGARTPDLLLDAVAIVQRSGHDLRLRLIGENSDSTRDAALAKGVGSVVELTPAMPHHEALAALTAADVAVIYQQDSGSAVTAVAGKTHEYLRAGKPILIIAPAGDNVALVEWASEVYRAVHQPADATAVADAIAQMMEMKRQGSLPQTKPPCDEYLRRYSRQALAVELAGHLDSAVEHATRTRGVS